MSRMISLDTNLLVRLLTNDEPKQTEKVRKALDQAQVEQKRIWVSVVVACELVWVLQRLYGYDKAQIVFALSTLLKFQGLEFQSHQAIKKSVGDMRRGQADFADILMGHLSAAEGADFVLTFDKQAAKLATHKLLT